MMGGDTTRNIVEQFAHINKLYTYVYWTVHHLDS